LPYVLLGQPRPSLADFTRLTQTSKLDVGGRVSNFFDFPESPQPPAPTRSRRSNGDLPRFIPRRIRMTRFPMMIWCSAAVAIGVCLAVALSIDAHAVGSLSLAFDPSPLHLATVAGGVAVDLTALRAQHQPDRARGREDCGNQGRLDPRCRAASRPRFDRLLDASNAGMPRQRDR